MIRKSLRIISIFFIVVTFLAICSVVDILIGNKKRKLIFFTRTASFFIRLLLAAFGVNPSYKNFKNLSDNKSNYLIVSNHLSYIDIFMIFSVKPSLFVANSGLKSEFLLGTVTGYAGGIFVERKKATLSMEIDMISDLLNEGFNVVLFPEATTSNGDGLLPFKNPFLASALRSKVDIVPICIKYRKIDGDDVNISNRDDIYYYGDAKFFDHALKLLSHKSVEADVIELEKIEVKPTQSRKELSNLAFDIINKAYHNL